MVKSFRVIFISVLVLTLSCESSNEIDDLVVDVAEVVPFDELAYLEELNSEDVLYMNTNTYNKIIENNSVINYDRSIDKEYLREISNRDFDSVFINLKDDTLFLTNAFFIRGGTGNEVFAFLEVIERDIYLRTPWLEKASVIIDKGDTIYKGELLGCDCAGSVEQRFKIPLSKLENTEHLYFKGEEIKFR